MEQAPLPSPALNIFTRIRGTWLSRHPQRGGSLAFALATLALVVGSIFYWSDYQGLTQLMAASPKAVFQDHQYWRLFTSLFVHADPRHLLSNSFLFFILGSLLAGYFGPVLVPLCAFLCGALINYFALKELPVETTLIGASGIVFWLGGAWLSLYALLDRTRSWGQRGLRVFGVGLLLFMPAETFDPGISYRSHALGFLFGILWGVLLYAVERSRFRAAESTEVVVEEFQV